LDILPRDPNLRTGTGKRKFTITGTVRGKNGNVNTGKIRTIYRLVI
jgi:hypothetical protein